MTSRYKNALHLSSFREFQTCDSNSQFEFFALGCSLSFQTLKLLAYKQEDSETEGKATSVYIERILFRIMYSKSFDYYSAKNLDKALDLLNGNDGEVKLLAGGQSLIPSLKLKVVFSESCGG